MCGLEAKNAIFSKRQHLKIVKPKGFYWVHLPTPPQHPPTHPHITFFWSQRYGKLRLFYSGTMALILPWLKDITNFVLKLICSLFTLFINFVCLSLCPWLSPCLLFSMQCQPSWVPCRLSHFVGRLQIGNGGGAWETLVGVIDIKIFEDLELLKNLWILNIDDGVKHDNSIDNMH